MAEAATKTAIVTGGAGGVARALLPMLIGDGYRVALIDVNAIGLGKMATEHGGKVVALPCDRRRAPRPKSIWLLIHHRRERMGLRPGAHPLREAGRS
jgi:NAD(P)-dependent dehydrogenase (short-subunit alcohol dehydrogenase family)